MNTAMNPSRPSNEISNALDLTYVLTPVTNFHPYTPCLALRYYQIILFVN